MAEEGRLKLEGMGYHTAVLDKYFERFPNAFEDGRSPEIQLSMAVNWLVMNTHLVAQVEQGKLEPAEEDINNPPTLSDNRLIVSNPSLVDGRFPDDRSLDLINVTEPPVTLLVDSPEEKVSQRHLAQLEGMGFSKADARKVYFENDCDLARSLHCLLGDDTSKRAGDSLTIRTTRETPESPNASGSLSNSQREDSISLKAKVKNAIGPEKQINLVSSDDEDDDDIALNRLLNTNPGTGRKKDSFSATGRQAYPSRASVTPDIQINEKCGGFDFDFTKEDKIIPCGTVNSSLSIFLSKRSFEMRIRPKVHQKENSRVQLLPRKEASILQASSSKERGNVSSSKVSNALNYHNPSLTAARNNNPASLSRNPGENLASQYSTVNSLNDNVSLRTMRENKLGEASEELLSSKFPDFKMFPEIEIPETLSTKEKKIFEKEKKRRERETRKRQKEEMKQVEKAKRRKVREKEKMKTAYRSGRLWNREIRVIVDQKIPSPFLMAIESRMKEEKVQMLIKELSVPGAVIFEKVRNPDDAMLAPEEEHLRRSEQESWEPHTDVFYLVLEATQFLRLHNAGNDVLLQKMNLLAPSKEARINVIIVGLIGELAKKNQPHFAKIHNYQDAQSFLAELNVLTRGKRRG